MYGNAKVMRAHLKMYLDLIREATTNGTDTQEFNNISDAILNNIKADEDCLSLEQISVLRLLLAHLFD